MLAIPRTLLSHIYYCIMNYSRRTLLQEWNRCSTNDWLLPLNLFTIPYLIKGKNFSDLIIRRILLSFVVIISHLLSSVFILVVVWNYVSDHVIISLLHSAFIWILNYYFQLKNIDIHYAISYWNKFIFWYI